MHVTARLDRATATKLQRRRAYAAIHRALALSLARVDFRIIHLAVLAHRLELVVEADDKVALARGMQGFQVSAARWLNAAARRHGCVFPDRYRMTILRTRHAVRDAIGRLPQLRAVAWPETWLLRVEASPRVQRRWIHTRGDEDSGSEHNYNL